MGEPVNLDTPEWTDWTKQRPPCAGYYWWRVRPSTYGGMILRPEWVDEFRLMGMGRTDNALWPRFSHWDGYRRTVPELTQWRAGTYQSAKDYRFPGLDLLGCPFCGRVPNLKWVPRHITAAIYESYQFRIACDCGLATTGYGENLCAMVQRWNTRAETAK